MDWNASSTENTCILKLSYDKIVKCNKKLLKYVNRLLCNLQQEKKE